MNKIIYRQKGITFLGVVFVLAIIASFVLFGLKLFPLYNTKFGILKVMTHVVTQPDAAAMSQTDAWKLFYNNADIQGLRMFELDKTVKEHVKVERTENGNVLHVIYEERNKLFDDIELVLNFDKSMPMGGGTGGGDE